MTALKDCVLGIELGSTRIKAVLLDKQHRPVASGSYSWENELKDGVWTYSLADAEKGLQACFADLRQDAEAKLGQKLTTVGAIGVSAMMHGYLAFDGAGKLLVPFRTWRNTMTGEAAAKLSALFGFNIPQRWSIAHLEQALLNGEAHLPELRFFTTLAGWVHWRLTGEKVIGIGDASGMFPIDSETLDYNETMLRQFDALPEAAALACPLRGLLPKVLTAGQAAGKLTEEGAKLLDPSGALRPGIPLAPPEGDAGTGMAATNSVAVGTGNVSAGTSDFAMVVVDKLPGVHREIDMVTTPAGKPVAMVHCNNCTSDINAWAGLFGEFAEAVGVKMDSGALFDLLFRKALEGAPDGGGLLSYNYDSGEGVTDLDEGRPLFLRQPGARLGLGDFMRTHLMSALATLKIGLDILTGEEKVAIRQLYAHGGFFKTPEAGQRMLAAAVDAPVSVMETAGEGGPYGMALLCAYLLEKKEGEALETFLAERVFAGASTSTLTASPEDVEGFRAFLGKYRRAFPVEKAAVDAF